MAWTEAGGDETSAADAAPPASRPAVLTRKGCIPERSGCLPAASRLDPRQTSAPPEVVAPLSLFGFLLPLFVHPYLAVSLGAAHPAQDWTRAAHLAVVDPADTGREGRRRPRSPQPRALAPRGTERSAPSSFQSN
ncbi:hypothetical protein FOCC_FOCC016314, partial [Frankliniella occidentalis]